MEPSHEPLPGLIFPRLSSQHLLRVQLPLQLGEFSVPEPDLAVVSREERMRRDIESAAYAERTTAQAGDVLTSQAMPGLRVPLDAVW